MENRRINSRPLSRRSAQMPQSSIRRIFNAAMELQRQGRNVVRLDIGDPDLDLPERIADGVTEAFHQRRTHYSAMTGIRELREAIALHLEASRDVACGLEQVTVTQGGTQALNAALQLTCDPGDTILMPEVYWPNCIQQTTLAGVNPKFYPLDDRFQPCLEALEDVLGPGLKAILVNSPSNPTGAVFPPQVVEAIYDFADRHDLWIISDEAYTDYVFDVPHLSPLQLDWEQAPSLRRVLAVFSFSKSYAATGLRMGWVVAPDRHVARRLALLNEPLTGSLTTPLQWGLVQAFAEDDAGRRRHAVRRRRDLAHSLMTESGISVAPPQGGLFYFLDVSSSGMNGDRFADRLLEEEGVAVVPGSGFGLHPRSDPAGGVRFEAAPRADRCVRICFAVPEEALRKGIPRLAEFLRRSRV